MPLLEAKKHTKKHFIFYNSPLVPLCRPGGQHTHKHEGPDDAAEDEHNGTEGKGRHEREAALHLGGC